MSFVVAAESYDRFMGRYSSILAPLFADFAGVEPGLQVLEVGCGPGALTGELVGRIGAGMVTAVDPSEPFVAAVRERLPAVVVRQASAESLPFADDSFDLTVAQLVVHHMSDAVAGVREMRRVTRTGGTVSACVWDLAGGRAPLSPFWRAAKRFNPATIDESDFPGAREGELIAILGDAGLTNVEGDAITFEVRHATFEEWWEPFTLGVGPAGSYVVGLDPDNQARLAALSREEVGSVPFTLSLRVWCARGQA
jgi:SAM-dependent methyltransferase